MEKPLEGNLDRILLTKNLLSGFRYFGREMFSNFNLTRKAGKIYLLVAEKGGGDGSHLIKKV